MNSSVKCLISQSANNEGNKEYQTLLTHSALCLLDANKTALEVLENKGYIVEDLSTIIKGTILELSMSNYFQALVLTRPDLDTIIKILPSAQEFL